MTERAATLREAVVDRVLNGAGSTAPAARRAAFENRDVDDRVRALIDKVARQAWTVTDGDVSAARTAGLSENEIFELVVSAALGQATRQLQAARAALDAAGPSSAAPAAEGPAGAGGGAQ